MKNTSQILPGEIVRHTGDLTVNGTIGANAQLYIQDGSLIIHGNVSTGAHIEVTISDALRNKINPNPQETKHNISDTITANIAISTGANTGIYIGNVNVNNRIVTDHKLVAHGNGTYEITTPSFDTSSPEYKLMSLFTQAKMNHTPSKIAQAQIDGITYTGTKISLKGSLVFVDDKIMNSLSNHIKVSEQVHRLPPIVSVSGMISNNTTIHSDTTIEAQSIGDFCSITSTHDSIKVHNSVGSSSQLTAYGAIKIGSLGNNSSLTSNHNKIKVSHSSGNSAVIKAKKSINLKDVGNNAEITSEQDSVTTHTIGSNSAIQAKADIDISGGCHQTTNVQLKSTYGLISGLFAEQPQINSVYSKSNNSSSLFSTSKNLKRKATEELERDSDIEHGTNRATTVKERSQINP